MSRIQNVPVRLMQLKRDTLWHLRDDRFFEYKSVGRCIDPIFTWPWGDILDPWQVRNRFLNLADDDQLGLLSFLRETGVFSWDFPYPSIPEAYFRDVRRDLRQTLENPAKQPWYDRLASELGLSMRLEFGPKMPLGAVLYTEWTSLAMFASAWLDALRGAKFKYCERGDCPHHGPGKSPFEVTRRNQKFCTDGNCAHVEAVRQYRQRAARKRTRRKRKPRQVQDV
jgi:hypothetical protein